MASEKRVATDESEWVALLKRTTIRDLLASRPNRKALVVIEKGHTVHEAMQLLAEHDILAAPVVESKTQTGAFLGFVDVLDLAGFILHRYQLDQERMSDAAFVEDTVFHEPVENVVNFSQVDESHVVSEDANLHDTIHFFARNAARGLHRVAVSSSADGRTYIQGVLTQSDLVSFCSLHSDLIPQSSQAVSDLGLVRSIVAVMLDTPLHETLETLYRNRLSGLALLDPDGGRVATNFSASDLRALTKHSFRDFHKSVFVYLTRSGQGVVPVVTVAPTTTLAQAMQLMVEQRLHRVYIASEAEGSVRGLVSHSDILKLVHKHHGSEEHRKHRHSHHHKKSKH